MSKKSEYLSKYKEIEIIGRGNFGSATLVKNILNNQIFVAKKVLLGNLSQKEVEGAHLELKLLKQLNHPNIVSYYENFIEDGAMIIIMEYCEEGDLAFYIKHRSQKNEYMEEKLLLNWFLQLLLSLEYIHRQKILHRDIKSSNIFLTSNGTVKLGDFGISKVLENTHDAAITVVGTPYYMSPEVCENKPYTYKSDVWALGCVLYEMCTLKHAFSADNLLGLVFKIVREKNDPIPKTYSPELSQLVQRLLTKNDKLRPDIKEIFAIPFIQETIEGFIRQDAQGLKTMIRIPIKKTNLHNEIKRQQNQNQNTNNNNNNNNDNYEMETIKSTLVQTKKDELDATTVSIYAEDSYTKSITRNQQKFPQQYQQTYQDPYENLTPQQRIQRKKEEERQRNEEKLREAAKQNRLSIEQAKHRKQYELQGNITRQKDHTSYSVSTTAPNSATSNNSNSKSSNNNSQMNISGNLQQNQYSNSYNLHTLQVNSPSSNNAHYMNQGNYNGTNLPTYYSQVSNNSVFNNQPGNQTPGNQTSGMRKMENNFLEITNESLSLSLTSENNLHQQFNQDPRQFGTNQYNKSQNYGQYTLKTEYSNDYTLQQAQQSFIRPTIQDDRPLPALMNKNKEKNIYENPNTFSNAYENNYNNNNNNDNNNDDDEEYLDDFEEYNSDDDDMSRITVKASQQELSDVINLYKAKLDSETKKKGYGMLEEIKELNLENSQVESTKNSNSNSMMSSQSKNRNDEAILSKQARINAAKDKAIAMVGKKNYDTIYQFLKKERDLDRSDDYIKQKIGEMVGRDKKVYDACFMIDQILFLESFA